ncbi:hypothetical protein EZV62_014834 [Acer yangbiense]|uniref:NAC domain-containing protein n=1 Tax=Acer yangbiense TaxID=1000413 RepID=A0A5C7HT81_9ROSI|nr:hypothetical protein EZV62_014834 [Acer yangbiense]
MMKGGEIELPAGFRFHPTDEELVNHYLCRKCAGLPISVPIIAEIDLYKYDPWQLPGTYFFHFNSLDDWVLCRIYNKKGRIEKHLPIDLKLTKFPEAEDRKPDIRNSGQNMLFPPNPIAGDLLHMDSSESVPLLQTDSSCSEHVLSPEEVTCDREVQSEPKWNELDYAFGDIQFNYMDFGNDLFDPQIQYQMDPLQDMFTLLQKPF